MSKGGAFSSAVERERKGEEGLTENSEKERREEDKTTTKAEERRRKTQQERKIRWYEE